MKRASMAWVALCLVVARPVRAMPDYASFESGHVRPFARVPGGDDVLFADVEAGRLVRLRLRGHSIECVESVRVGLEPVAVAVDSRGRAWVTNHVSDTVSIVELAPRLRVVATLRVADEPSDVVFGGPGGALAFITVAHRGQDASVDPQVMIRGVGRADVEVYAVADVAAGVDPPPRHVLTVFADGARALAVSDDGLRLAVAGFHTGNGSTILPEQAVCDGGETAAPCLIEDAVAPGGLPGPNVNVEGHRGPEVGLLVHADAEGRFRDVLGRDWSDLVPISLPDEDVFFFDLSTPTPQLLRAVPHVGTTLFDVAFTPGTHDAVVVGVDLRNDMRLEPTLRARFAESFLTTVTAAGVARSPLHIPIDATLPPDAAQARLVPSQPVAIEPAHGGDAWVIAALGSSALFIADATSVEPGQVPSLARVDLSGGGPSGLLVDDEAGYVLVATRFDHGISLVDLETRTERAHVTLPTPEAPAVVRGRRELYDAGDDGYGAAACASCHVFAHDDALGWDLGDPGAPVVAISHPTAGTIGPEIPPVFHPLKGPMTTQSLRGLRHVGAMHWRGDRGGPDPRDADAALRAFAPAFVSLLGRAHAPEGAALDDFVAFMLSVSPPPNPYRPLDGSDDSAILAGRDEFSRSRCIRCHVVDRAAGQFGTTYLFVGPTELPGICSTKQAFQVPDLRQMYTKLGKGASVPSDAPEAYSGPQVRGFGFLHDGHRGPANADVMVPFLLAFETDFAPAVGKQVTLTDASSDADVQRAELLTSQATNPQMQPTGERTGACDVVAVLAADGRDEGYLLRAGQYHPDSARRLPLSFDALRARARTLRAPLTLTCAPPGTGPRHALDADRDGRLDGDEVADGTDPLVADPPREARGGGGTCHVSAAHPATAFPNPALALALAFAMRRPRRRALARVRQTPCA